MNDSKVTLAQLADQVGCELGVSSWFTIDQARIDQFAHCTDDHQWIHVDVDRARRERPSVGTVAHGYLTLALVAPTSFEVLSSRVETKETLNYGLDKVRFPAFVRSGARVRNRIRLLAIEDKGNGRHLLITENSFEIENEPKPGVVATALLLVAA
jgi:acyl dehydratase